MTYKHYILKNHLEDNKENFKKWALEYNTIYRMLNEEMLEQTLEYAYRMRFTA